MADAIDTVLFSGDALELVVAKAKSRRNGIEIFTPHSSKPQEPEAIAHVRNILTKFLVDNGYEHGEG